MRVPESPEVVDEEVRRGNRERRVEQHPCDFPITTYAFSLDDLRRMTFIKAILPRLLFEEGIDHLLPLYVDWPKLVPGDGQPPTPAQVAFPGKHYHKWGECWVDHGPNYTYLKSTTIIGTVTWYAMDI